MTGDSPELFEADEEEPEVLGVRARRDFLEVRLEDLLDDRLEDLLRSDSDDEEDSRWCLTPRDERLWCLGDLDLELDLDEERPLLSLLVERGGELTAVDGPEGAAGTGWGGGGGGGSLRAAREA